MNSRVIALICAISLATGCTRFKHLEYQAFVRDLDGLSQLHISTYPADSADRLNERGSLVEQYETARSLYFQLHIRDRKKQFGPNVHVQSILVHKFSYRMDGGNWVDLLSDYPDNFWMQGDPRYEANPSPAIPYLPDGTLTIAIDLTLNGMRFEFTGPIPASERSQVLPTAIVNQGI